MLLAVLMLTWHNVWMGGHGRDMAGVRNQVGAQVEAGERLMAALAVGIVVLIGGIALIASEIRFLPQPYSIIVVLAFGLILLMLGASFIDRGSGRP
jgi:hypothetical protein